MRLVPPPSLEVSRAWDRAGQERLEVKKAGLLIVAHEPTALSRR